MSDDFYGDGEEAPEPLLESVHKKPDEPEMAAVLQFDKGMDDIVSGLKKVMGAIGGLRQDHPEVFQEIETKLKTGLMPWLEAVDEDFSLIFPDAGE